MKTKDFTALDVYGKLKRRAEKFGREDLIEEIQKAEREPDFDIRRFVKLCGELKANPYLLFKDIEEPVIHFSPRTEEERELYAVAESVLYYAEEISLLGPGRKFPPDNKFDFYRELVFAGDKKPALDVVDLCNELRIGIFLLSSESPVDGFYAENSDRRRGTAFWEVYLFSRPEKEVFVKVFSECLRATGDRMLLYISDLLDNFEIEFNEMKCFSASYNREIFSRPERYVCFLGKKGAFFEKAKKHLFYPQDKGFPAHGLRRSFFESVAERGRLSLKEEFPLEE